MLVLGPRCSYSSRDAGTASADVSSGASAAVDAADVSSASVEAPAGTFSTDASDASASVSCHMSAKSWS